ncbi:hypothetical protein NC652_029075 [Populus alba x Populus x berolinensis]|uniref:Uncharacterized protein n=1 Tax=Populus alba x Populus x berolinensis TaxID=444605 RepID=A0AAD6M0U7_9ROSI|nr:hypothetical protein NC652_029075 [Populus alba x Populus x berolinensis]KAJ6976755.1 hypothetical protein NC653_028810 [Populus alba x Populus x berolinensis]
MGGAAAAAHVVKRIPRIKFPQRHAKSSSSGFVPQTQAASTDTEIHHFIMSSSEVPASPANIAEGGKASLQPKRTPVSEREIEAVQTSCESPNSVDYREE